MPIAVFLFFIIRHLPDCVQYSKQRRAASNLYDDNVVDVGYAGIFVKRLYIFCCFFIFMKSADIVTISLLVELKVPTLWST